MLPLSNPKNSTNIEPTETYHIMLDLTVVVNFAIDGVWINSLDDFGERFREKSVSQLL